MISKENYHLVIYDEIVAAAVRGRASDIHFSIRKAPHDGALIALRMFGRYQRLTGASLRDCPHCGRGQMVRIESFLPGTLPRGPPPIAP